MMIVKHMTRGIWEPELGTFYLHQVSDHLGEYNQALVV